MSKNASGGGNKKKGRAGRKPSHQRYNLERRWEKNKEKRAKKQQTILAKIARKKAKRAEKKNVEQEKIKKMYGSGPANG